VINIGDLRSASYDANMALPAREPDPLRCVLCGKVVRRSAAQWAVADAAIGSFLPVDDVPEQNGGCFPVGPDCARKLPKGYLV
jgi:hypothetical protein